MISATERSSGHERRGKQQHISVHFQKHILIYDGVEHEGVDPDRTLREAEYIDQPAVSKNMETGCFAAAQTVWNPVSDFMIQYFCDAFS